MTLGLRIVPNPLAVTTEVNWFLTKHPTQKRRRNWRAVRTTIEKPAALKTADGTIHMHPTLYAMLATPTGQKGNI